MLSNTEPNNYKLTDFFTRALIFTPFVIGSLAIAVAVVKVKNSPTGVITQQEQLEDK